MIVKISVYECAKCKERYEDREDAEKCAEGHADVSQMCLTDLRFKPNSALPDSFLIKDKRKGITARYKRY